MSIKRWFVQDMTIFCDLFDVIPLSITNEPLPQIDGGDLILNFEV